MNSINLLPREIIGSIKKWFDKPEKVVVVTRDYLDKIKYETDIYFVPLWMV